jgi:cell division protein FtsB
MLLAVGMGYWEMIYKCTWFALGILFVLALSFMFWPKIHRHRELQLREQTLNEEIRFETELINHLKEKQRRFLNDKQFVERIAHDQGMVKPNETIFNFVNEEPKH